MTTIAIDIGATWTKVGIVGASCEISHNRRLSTAGPADKFVGKLSETLRPLFVPSQTRIGVAVAGFLDGKRSRMTYNPNIAWLEEYPLKRSLEEQFGAPVEMDNDANCAALAEYHFGAGRGAKRFLTIAVGTGIGTAMIADGEMMRCAGETLGDAGHIIVNPNGPDCTCGGRGCGEACANAVKLLENPEAAGRCLGILSASLAAVLLPDKIAIGGAVLESLPQALAAARQAFFEYTSARSQEEARIVGFALGGRAPLLGAALLGPNADRPVSNDPGARAIA